MPRTDARVGQQARFDPVRRTINLLADLEVTTKAVEPTAESIGGDIAATKQQIRRALTVRSDGRDRKTIRILSAHMPKWMAPASPS